MQTEPGALIKAARKALDLTQSQAAERCGVSFSALEKWERGAPIQPPMLIGVLMLLDVPRATALAAAKDLMCAAH